MLADAASLEHLCCSFSLLSSVFQLQNRECLLSSKLIFLGVTSCVLLAVLLPFYECLQCWCVMIHVWVFFWLSNWLFRTYWLDHKLTANVFRCQSHNCHVSCVRLVFIYLFISPLKLQLLALRSCLAFVPTLKSSADTGVRNVPWYLMSGSILASFSLAFWRIRAADSWCEILAVSHSLMTVAHETAQVKIIQKKNHHICQ